MFIPAHFLWQDAGQIISFLQEYNFGLLVTMDAAGVPQATHLPFVVEKDEDENIVLIAHMARANAQWKTFGDPDVLVVFSGPHAYISPRHYNKKENVPTWNYAAVHIFGQARIIEDSAAGYRSLEKLMATTEPEFLPQYATLDENYRSGLFKGIVPFIIRVTRIEAKEKISQNKTRDEQQRIIDALKESPATMDAEMGRYMEKHYGSIR